MPPGGASALEGNESSSSGVSWAAVIGGAFVAASLGLILLALGTGVGLAVVSPWSNAGVSAATLGVSTIVWMIIVQLVSSAMGGYLAGRLRTRWVSVHTDEVFFRDTAHGFLVWAVGLVLTAAFLSSAAATLVTGMAQGGASAVAGAAQMGAAQMSRMDRRQVRVDRSVAWTIILSIPCCARIRRGQTPRIPPGPMKIWRGASRWVASSPAASVRASFQKPTRLIWLNWSRRAQG
jgi:hypothetical protein